MVGGTIYYSTFDIPDNHEENLQNEVDGDNVEANESLDLNSSTPANKNRSKKKRATYMPPKNSCLWHLMDEHEQKLKGVFGAL